MVEWVLLTVVAGVPGRCCVLLVLVQLQILSRSSRVTWAAFSEAPSSKKSQSAERPCQVKAQPWSTHGLVPDLLYVERAVIHHTLRLPVKYACLDYCTSIDQSRTAHHTSH